MNIPAIKLYSTKSDAFYFKDSQINNFYEFGGIQLIPNTTYTQKSDSIELSNSYSISVLNAYDDSVLGKLQYSISSTNSSSNLLAFANSTSVYANNDIQRVDTYYASNEYWSITPTQDFGSNLIYLRFEINQLVLDTIKAFKNRVSAASGTFEDTAYLSIELSYLSSGDLTYYYTNPFYITANDEDSVTSFSYKDLSTENLQTLGLKVWFRQKSRQTELTTYYESSTRNTVTQAIKSHNLEIYDSEYMSIDDLILTSQVLESPYLYIGSTRYALFEAVKIPELTQQENFAKIKFTLAPNN